MKVAIIGGGLSGCVAAMRLVHEVDDVEVCIYEERGEILSSGAPYNHLHSGGTLLHNILLHEGQVLLEQSLRFMKYFESCIQERPVVVAYDVNSDFEVSELLFRCNILKLSYKAVHTPSDVFVDPCVYYCVYTRADMMYYKTYGTLPESIDEARRYHDVYVESFCNMLEDVDSIKYPFVSVCEFGIDQKRVEEICRHSIESNKNKIEVKVNKYVDENVINESEMGWELEGEAYDMIINACGWKRDRISKYRTLNLGRGHKNKQFQLESSWLLKANCASSKFPAIAIMGTSELQVLPTSQGAFEVMYKHRDSSLILQTDNDSTMDECNVIRNDGICERETQKRATKAKEEMQKRFPVFESSKIMCARWGVHVRDNSINFVISDIVISRNYIGMQTSNATGVVAITDKIIDYVKYVYY